ncbi:MAG: carbon-nitrogen hydrolase family protein [Verrucomicrobiota bacterium]
MKAPATPASKLRVAAVQMRFTTQLDRNIEKIALASAQAKRRRADVVLFPECTTTAYNTDFSALKPAPLRQALQTISDIACQHQINLLVGSPLFHRRKLYNALIAFDRTGKPVHAYAKNQLTPADTAHFSPGNALAHFQLDGIKVTAIICHERRYPELIRIPVMAGAQIIFHPNAGLDSRSVSRKKHNGKDGIATRAFENAAHYLFANSVGHQGDQLWSAGDSKIVAANGKTLAQAGNSNEEIIYATLDLNQATRKYALDSLQHPEFLRSHWKAIIRESKQQAQKVSAKLLSELF